MRRKLRGRLLSGSRFTSDVSQSRRYVRASPSSTMMTDLSRDSADIMHDAYFTIWSPVEKGSTKFLVRSWVTVPASTLASKQLRNTLLRLVIKQAVQILGEADVCSEARGRKLQRHLSWCYSNKKQTRKQCSCCNLVCIQGGEIAWFLDNTTKVV